MTKLLKQKLFYTCRVLVYSLFWAINENFGLINDWKPKNYTNLPTEETLIFAEFS